MFMGGGGGVSWGRYRGFSGGDKVLRGKVQSPESRVQGPVLLLGYACFRLGTLDNAKSKENRIWGLA